MKTYMPYRKYLFILGIIGAFFAIAHVTLAAGTDFVSMSQFPAFKTSNSGDLSDFINSLYKYLIGIAAILAVLEITWGGFLWMGSGASVTSKEAGRNKIMMALTGLLLVLSPVIIFSIINPSVLSLKLGTNSINIKQPLKIVNTLNISNTKCSKILINKLIKKYKCVGTSPIVTLNLCIKPLDKATISNPKTIKGNYTRILTCSATKTFEQTTATPSLQAYEFALKTSTFSVSKWKFFPNSYNKYNLYKNTCLNSGGTVKKTFPLFLVNLNKNPLYATYSKYRYSCRNSGYPKIPSTTKKTLGEVCFSVRLSCDIQTTN